MCAEQEKIVVFAVRDIKPDDNGGNDWYQLAPAGEYGQRAPRKGELLKPATLSDALPKRGA